MCVASRESNTPVAVIAGVVVAVVAGVLLIIVIVLIVICLRKRTYLVYMHFTLVCYVFICTDTPNSFEKVSLFQIIQVIA